MSTKLHPIKHDLKTVLWCGPAALATISGQPTSVVREAIRQHVRERNGKPAVIKGLNWTPLIAAARTLGYELKFRSIPGKRPTLAQWLRQNREHYRDTPYIVNVTGHYVTVCGRSFIDNKTGKTVPLSQAPGRRCRVVAYFRVEKSAAPVALPSRRGDSIAREPIPAQDEMKAKYYCKKCNGVVTREIQNPRGRTWFKSYCTVTQQDSRLYRMKGTTR